MMAELIDNMNDLSGGVIRWNAYQSILFPAPATELEKELAYTKAELAGEAYDCH
jgi:hypothetical protein